MASEPVDTFPRQHARTRRFTAGEPRDVVVSPDGRRVTFLRSRGGSDPVNCLWTADATSGVEHLVADPAVLLTEDRDLPPEELALRERTREVAAGITSFATDRAVTVAAFTLGGQLFVAGLVSGRARLLDVAGPVFDPRPDPLARRVAYVSGRLLCIAELDGSWRVVAGGELDEPETVTWGSAEFIAAEEMHRVRGYWWSPDGDTIAVCRADTAPVQRWFISDPAQPGLEPREVAYPAAGTPNAEVTLHLFPVAGGEPVDVEWDRGAFEYLADVQWSDAGLLIAVQARDQRRLEVRRVDVTSGSTEPVFADRDDAWVELVPGSPRLLPDGRLVVCADRDGACRLLVAGVAVTPAHLQVRSIVACDEAGIVFHANPVDDATSLHVWRWTPSGGIHALTDEPGVHTAVAAGEALVVRSTTSDEPGARWVLPSGGRLVSHAETPLVRPDVRLLTSPSRGLATAVLLPAGHDGSPLPVLLDPYGGPHAQRVVRSSNAFATSQWFADQGFAVVVVDGRGTPGRGTDFERAVRGDLGTAALDDQIDGLHHAAEKAAEKAAEQAAEHGGEPGAVLDLDRVAIRGWSYGGYLAALAVLRRPDIFHAAIAGAPVTEWRLYDTHYTERYLGDPSKDPAAYDASSLLPFADQLTRPLLLIHGLADDNVVAAHTLLLSSALLAAGKPHEVLPLVGVTHMTPQEVVAEHLLLHQLDFLRRALPAAPASDEGTPAGYGAIEERR